MKLIRHILTVAGLEMQYFFHHRKLALAVIVVAFVPALYSLIYLSSVWDPEAHSNALPVGIVNLDEGLQYRDHVFNIGLDVQRTLKAQGRFGFRELIDEDEARRQVRRGELAFALILPRDFSANAIPGNSAGAGKPIVVLSEGNNIESAGIARRFAQRLDQDINENLNEQRWGVVFSNALGSQRSVDVLRKSVADLDQGGRALADGAAQTAAGSQKLATGTHQLADNTRKLIDGAQQVGTALGSIDAQRPPQQDLNRLRNGTDALVRGHEALGNGLLDLRNGTQQLHVGVETMHHEVSQSIWAPTALTDGTKDLLEGVAKLDGGAQAAVDANNKLSDGARQVRTGTNRLLTGVRTLGDAIHEINTKLPPASQYDALSHGAEEVEQGADKVTRATRDVAGGAKQLSLGLAQLHQALPVTVAKPDGSPQGLAHSVEPHLEVEAPVENSGSGFAPNIISAALWLGAGVAVFLLHVRVLPQQARPMPPVARLLGKITLPTGIVVLQVLAILALVTWVLHIQILHPLAFALILVLSGMTFLLITFALARAGGDAGKGIAMVLLAIQLSSSGGIMPVELSGRLFMDISPWLPLTWVIKALKASMFGAFDGDWLTPVQAVLPWTIIAAMFAIYVGRWRFVDQDALFPPVDI
ncbi:MAG: YhgE/Pip domain-containing protein [Rhodocyclaceae bacterium]